MKIKFRFGNTLGKVVSSVSVSMILLALASTGLAKKPVAPADILHMTVEEVKCISPSTGQDSTTSALFMGLGAAAAVAATYATAGAATPITAPMVLAAMGTGAKGGSQAKGIFGNFFAGSDDLMIKINGKKIWPADKTYVDIDSQQTIKVNTEFVYMSNKGAKLQLVEYDYGSFDDDLGTVMIKGVGLPYKETLVLANKSEGSYYEVKVKIYKPNQ